MTATSTSSASTPASAPPVLRITDLEKNFGPITALSGINLEIPRQQVLGLIGENGAGKSSLLKILTGGYQPDSGTIEINGQAKSFRGPRDAAAAGIGVVHQEQSLLTNLSVAENIAMNATGAKDEATRFGWYRWKQLNAEAAEVLAKVGADIDPRTRVGDLSFVDRQMVEIARALRVDEIVHAAPLIILDEPTSVLERNETEILEREIRKLKELGAVIFVSHRLDEVMRICDRVVVMRSGSIVAERRTDQVTEDELFQLMIGHDHAAVSNERKERTTAAPVLEVKGLSRRHAYRDVSFTVAPGDVLALVGTVGSGREEVSRAVFGAEEFDSGELHVDGRTITSWTVPQAVRGGVAYVPAERKVEGMVSGLTAAENMTLTHAGGSRKGFLVNRKAQRAVAQEWMTKLDVRPPDPMVHLDRFSGGNQQKVVMAKWLLADDLKVLVLDHPLRGLDPGAKEVINAQIRAAAEQGAAVVLLPDTLEEALDMADQIVVMRDGEVTGRFDSREQAPTALDLLERMV